MQRIELPMWSDSPMETPEALYCGQCGRGLLKHERERGDGLCDHCETDRQIDGILELLGM